MAATFVQDPAAFNDVDDDDGMPPLVDNPYPSMTFTFSAEMTPITYSTDPTRFEVLPDNANEPPVMYSPPASPTLGPIRIAHAKKRDASYIPRPPNAFILFRSSFIKAQHIPGKIEGNHSALSKIIGKYWKALPREDKEVWEAKAIVAQAEHRRKYPDWRFRPGANALAKVKDGPKKRTNRKGRGEAEKEERSREKRCAKIADLLVAGKTGMALEAAVEEYDCENGGPKIKRECGMLLMRLNGGVQPSTGLLRDATGTLAQNELTPAQATESDNILRKQSRSLSPDATALADSRFKTPLTLMFKRSSSAPAPYTRVDTASPSPSVVSSSVQDVDNAVPTSPTGTIATPSPVENHEGESRVRSDITRTSDAGLLHLDVNHHASPPPVLSPKPLVANYSPPGVNVSQSSWNTYSTPCSDVDPYSPSLPAFDSDFDDGTSPAQSPLAYTFDLNVEGDSIGGPLTFINNPPTSAVASTIYGNSQPCYPPLTGWVDNGPQKNPSYDYTSLIYGHNAPMVFDPDRVMKDAFAAAATAQYEDWSVGYAAADPHQFTSARDLQSLHFYAQSYDEATRRQGDIRQLL